MELLGEVSELSADLTKKWCINGFMLGMWHKSLIPDSKDTETGGSHV